MEALVEDHWEFPEYERAFASFYQAKESDDSVVLVISLDNYVSGYWLEQGTQPNENTRVYRTLDDVKALERRVLRALRLQRNALSFGIVL